MNTNINQKGFTIVELLIVVVVIAILAAISIVAYTGITNRANRSAAMEAANSVKSVVVAYNGANGSYPSTKTLMVSGGADAIAKLPSDICFAAAVIAAAPASNGCTTAAPGNGAKTVSVQYHGAAASITGYTITYWDYAPEGGGAAAARTMTVGDTTGAGTIVTNAS
jgi:prepilin-type N-terminal cleavage/methylation domain-containing protein